MIGECIGHPVKSVYLSALVVGLSIVLAGAYVVHLQMREPAGTSGSTAQSVAANVQADSGSVTGGEETAALRREIARLRAEIRDGTQPAPDSGHALEGRLVSELTRLSRVIARLEGEVDSLRADMAANSPDAESVDAFEVARSEEGNRDTPQSLLDRAEQTEEDAKRISAELENGFAVETKDPEWSESTANKIALALTRQEIAGAEVFEAECRSTLCRVEVEHTDVHKLHEFQLWFPHLVSGELPKVTMKTEDLADGRKSTIIYMARKGHELPGASNAPQ